MADGTKKKLGKVLLQQKLVTQQDLEFFLGQQATSGRRLASTISDAGAVPDVDLLKALSEQHGVPGIDLAQVVIPLDNLDLVPIEIARRHRILPVLVRDDRIFLAMADPSERRVIDELEFVTGKHVLPYVALERSLESVIGLAYQLKEQGQAHFVGGRVPPEYLRSIGLSPPEPMPGGTPGFVVGEDPDSSGSMPPDEMGDDELVESLTPAPMPAPPRGTTGNARYRILVVDDEDAIRVLLKRALSDRGYAIIEAADGRSALLAVKQHVPDCILLDAMLPQVHGFDICRRIKGSRKYGHIPVVMISAIYRGWRVAEDLKQSYGVDAFVEKPFKIHEVVAAVERVLHRESLEPDLSVDPESLSAESESALASGIAAYQTGDLDNAIGHLQRGITIDPLAFRLHYHLGLLFGRRGNVYEAIAELETAVELHPRHFSALKNLAVLYQKAGFKLKAIEMWERALRSSPDDETRRGIKEHLVNLL
ncbi:MAG: response regulator [Deltaproteobacteria bacterium]|nr:response regulator [Deltaproteobacteria bacterium]